MQKILNINGMDYNISYDGNITPYIEDLVRNTIMEQQNEMTLGTSTCPSTGQITQGSSHPITLTAASGTPPFTFNVDVDTTPTLTYTGGVSETSHTFTYTFPESTGSHTYKGTIINSCGSDSSQCSISITSGATPTPTPPPCTVPSCNFSIS